MLLVAGILCAISTVLMVGLIFMVNIMSPTGRAVTPWWPAAILALATAACFVARHFLAGHPITW